MTDSGELALRPLPVRVEERLVVERLAAASGQQAWESFMALDDELDRIAADADRGLAFPASFPIVT